MEAEAFDLIVFGGGKAGKTLAMDQAKAGKRVAMVERGLIGGSCINVACIPSKALIRSAELHALAGDGSAYGSPAEVGLDMAAVAGRTAAVVAEMVATNRKGFEASGLDLVLGWGKFVAPRVIEVATDAGPRRLTAPAIYLNLGTVADVPAIPGLAAAEPMTHVEALRLETLPDRLIVLGGGYIGLELGQAFRKLGAEVLIIEQGPQIAAREDTDIAEAMTTALRGDGIGFAVSAKVTEVSGLSGEQVTVTFEDGSCHSGSHLLVAAGRRPMTSGIGLELAGVELDARGLVKTDPQLRTTAEGIWALGEIAGTPMFTHASLDDYRVIKSRMTGGDRTTTGRMIPYCVFIDPELARVGLNEKEAAKLGIAYRRVTLPMDVVPRARTLGERKGFMKALIGDDDRILGFAMLGAQAGEVMTAVHMAMLGGLPYTTVRDAIIAHPTLAEGLGMLFAVQPAKP
ncbi:MAG: FAD-dependent oxidoreductase [Sphingomonas oligoaromativorans]|uniref:FAD-dependent oxidoreductase n=1 Tax=Sphingomonas oligoaromativorans TaxID=575322 RepID=UPI0014240462|nr:FAD-dependent oxidoreductase [Sphingomonas oligoaromativorans]NIJ35213.1 pyruvate/2-oxoglutarate dehydrogenase complex dihydrolipoamide dehydrogenase (E3) component [Sphingomonas oligoaromativorans]